MDGCFLSSSAISFLDWAYLSFGKKEKNLDFRLPLLAHKLTPSRSRTTGRSLVIQ